MKKIIKTVLKIILSVFLAFVSLLSLFIFIFLKSPQIIINSKNLDRFAYLSHYLGVIAHWDKSDVKVTSYSLLHKRFDLSWDNFCFDSSSVNGCFQKIHLVTEFQWQKGFEIVELGPLDFIGGELNLEIKEGKKDKNKEISFEPPALVLPKFLQSTLFRKSTFEINSLQLKSGEKEYVGNITLSLNPSFNNQLHSISIQGKIQSDGFLLKEADLALASESNFMKEDWKILGKAQLEKSPIETVFSKFEIWKLEPHVYQYRLDVDLKKDRLVSSSKIEGKITPEELQGKVSLEMTGVRKEIKKVFIENCSIDLKRLETNKHRGRISLDCPIQVNLTPLQLPSATYKKYVTVPERVDFLVKTDFETSFYPDFDQSIAGNLWVELKPISQKLFKFQANLKTDFSGIPSQYPKDWKIESDLQSSLVISEFQRIVQILQSTAFAVPAPLNALKGAIDFGVSGKIDLARETGKLPLYFKTALQSKDQNFNLDGKGELSYRYVGKEPISDLFFDLKLASLKIALPRFDFTSSVPQFFPDSRIVDEPIHLKKKITKLPIRTHVRVYTPPEQPILLVSNLAKSSIPILVDLNLEDEKLGGALQIGETDLNFFKRDAKIRRFKVQLSNPRAESELSGLIEVALTDYLIKIIVLGTVEKPEVIFRSEPPLSQEQIMSTLIFGRSFDELDTNSATSVGSFSAALADRAISLASLYILASTPIESIGYNPQTRAFLAKIRLAKGMSLNLGTEWGKSQQVGVNKKLGRSWFLKTYIENNQETNQQSGGASLEWSKRY